MKSSVYIKESNADRRTNAMKRTVHENIHTPYSLHDMNAVALEIDGDNLIMRLQSGMVCTTNLIIRWMAT